VWQPCGCWDSLAWIWKRVREFVLLFLSLFFLSFLFFVFLFGGGLRDDTGHGMIVISRLGDAGSVCTSTDQIL